MFVPVSVASQYHHQDNLFDPSEVQYPHLENGNYDPNLIELLQKLTFIHIVSSFSYNN